MEGRGEERTLYLKDKNNMPCGADGNTQQETVDRVTTALITQINVTEPVTQLRILVKRSKRSVYYSFKGTQNLRN